MIEPLLWHAVCSFFPDFSDKWLLSSGESKGED